MALSRIFHKAAAARNRNLKTRTEYYDDDAGDGHHDDVADDDDDEKWVRGQASLIEDEARNSTSHKINAFKHRDKLQSNSPNGRNCTCLQSCCNYRLERERE